jgi:cell division protein FtsI (penicillin-binding protein 3)
MLLRLWLVWLVLVVGASSLAWRLYQLQIIQGEELLEKARQQQVVPLSPYLPRRDIIDRQKDVLNVLATDRLAYLLYAHPNQFSITKAEIAAKLAEVLPRYSTAELVKKFKEKESGILLVNPTNPLSEEEANQVRKLNQNGLELNKRYSRYYPQQEMLADVIGYVDLEHRGQAGIEANEEKLLQRKPRTSQINITRNGDILPANLPDGFLNFDNLRLQLTLDLRLQRAARSALKATMAEYKGLRGAVAVMDVTDGSILALACEPTYDPNLFYQANIQLFKNWTITDLYEPGSTFKPINVAIALEAGAIQANSIFHDPGKIKIGKATVYNHDFHDEGGHGDINIAEILQYSSNVGMIQIIQRLKPSYYYDRLQNLEIEKLTGIDLPGEVAGQIKKKATFISSPIEPATASFGQGFSLTPLKLLQLHAAIANGGILVTPHTIQGLVDDNQRFHWQPKLTSKRIFSPKTSKTVLEMMETVVEEGSGKPSQIPGYRIAGKTGTAQKASPRGGYDPKAKITSFVSILPVESPRYVVLALLDEPKGSYTFGSTVAAPLAKTVMDTLISIEHIPPSSTPVQKKEVQ